MQAVLEVSPHRLQRTFRVARLDGGEHEAVLVPSLVRRVWARVERVPTHPHAVAVVWDERTAVALISPDAPLVQVGEFNFGPPRDGVARERNPMLLSWISNNYWDTNFPQTQSGRRSLPYGLLTLDCPDHDAIHERVAAMRTPLLAWPVTTHGRGCVVRIAHGELIPRAPSCSWGARRKPKATAEC